MAEIDFDVHLIQVTKDKLLDFLKKAQEKILIAKPGYAKNEIETLLSLKSERKIECTVFIDPDENAVRYGFGDVQALKLAQSNIDMLNLQTISGIRLSVVIVDDRALIFTPAALSWEEEPQAIRYPNGLTGGKGLVDQLMTQFKVTQSFALLPQNVTNFPTVTVEQVKKAVTQQTLKETVQVLDKNPPVDPAVLRQVNIYRNVYKLLKYQIKGAQIKNKTLDLRPFNKMLPESNQHLKRSWQVFTAEDIKTLSGFPEFTKDILSLVTTHTADAGRHGYLVSLITKATLEEEINKKKKSFMESLGKENGPGKDLKTSLERSRQGLITYLKQELNTSEPIPEQLFARNRVLLKNFKDQFCSQVDRARIVQQVIEDFVDYNLKFPEVTALIDSVDVVMDYYDVSDELLNDEEFKKHLKEAKVDPRKYDQGYEKKESN